jgi:hypothetical protein
VSVERAHAVKEGAIQVHAALLGWAWGWGMRRSAARHGVHIVLDTNVGASLDEALKRSCLVIA